MKKKNLIIFFKQAYAAGVECIIMASDVGQQSHFKINFPIVVRTFSLIYFATIKMSLPMVIHENIR